MLRTPIFWLLYVMMTLVSVAGLTFTPELSKMARDYQVADVDVTLRHSCPIWNEGAIAGFGASIWFDEFSSHRATKARRLGIQISIFDGNTHLSLCPKTPVLESSGQCHLVNRLQQSGLRLRCD